MTTEETWKPVVGFEGVYEVSDLGNVRSVDRELPSGRWGHVKRKGHPLKLKISKQGRPVIGLRLNGKRTWRGVNVLVCEAFHGPKPTPVHQVAHFPDRDPTNNRPGNLRWATPLENHQDRRIHEPTPTGEKNHFAQISADQVAVIRREYKRGRPCHPGNHHELAERFGLCPAHVQNIANGRAWAHLT